MHMSTFTSSFTPNRRLRGVLAAVVAMAFAIAGNDSQATQPTGSMSYARSSHTAASLPDGRVLIVGGNRVSGSLSGMTPTAEIYDPATGNFTLTGALATARAEQATATLADGRILVVGGLSWADGTTLTLNSGEIYDPAGAVWNATGTMSTARRAPIALTLQDGRVLVIGGSSAIASTEVYDPATNSFTPTGSMTTGRGNPAAAVLADGRVLVAGGYPATNSPWYSSAEVWDPATGTWTATGSLTSVRAYATATALSNGKVLVAGGYNGSTFPTSSELYDPATGTFTQSGTLAVAREGHVAKILPDGNVLISGGTASTWSNESSDEIYDVAAGTWRTTGWMSTARYSHTLSVLPNGNVLIAGGGPGPLASAELYFPSCYLAGLPLAPTSANFASGGSSSSVSLTVPLSCGWTITRVPSWMTVTSGLSGTGSTTVSYTIAAMTTTGGRGATPRIADMDFPVNQSGVCSPAILSATSASFTASAGSGSVNVSEGFGCSWAVTGVPAWITITAGASGSGNGSVSYTVAANTGAARSVTLSIGNSSYVVNQAAAPVVCDPNSVPSISPGSASYASSSGSGTVAVTYGAGCAWSVSGVPSWITINSGASGQGNGTVSYSVASNAGLARSATLTIATKSFSVTQAAASSGCTGVTYVTSGVPASGALAGGDCTSSPRGSNYYDDRYYFNGAPGQHISVQLSSSAFDTYVYLKDPSNTVIASNDDGGGGTNSRIPASSGNFTLPAGSAGLYTIEVTSYGSFATGAYTVTYTQY